MINKVFKALRHVNAATISPTKLLNRSRLTKSYSERSSRIKGFPKILQIETTSACSLDCIMCPRKDMTRKSEHMSLDLFRKIIDEARGKAEVAILHLMGDPLLNPKIFEMIRYCKEAGIRNVVSTNGVVLSEEASRKLYESGLDIILLSFDGATKEVFESVRVGANFEKVTASYRRFLEMQEQFEHKIRAIVQMIRFKTTESEVKDFYQLWDGVNADIIVKPFTHWQGNQEDINELSHSIDEKLNTSLCDRAWQWLTVISDGSVIPCCRDYDATIRFGNLKDNSIEEIWNGEGFREFRRLHALGRSNHEICKDCDYQSLIDGNFVAMAGTTILDSYTLLSTMYDLHYIDE